MFLPVIRQQSFFPPQSALRQGRSASAFCQSTSVPAGREISLVLQGVKWYRRAAVYTLFYRNFLDPRGTRYTRQGCVMLSKVTTLTSASPEARGSVLRWGFSSPAPPKKLEIQKGRHRNAALATCNIRRSRSGPVRSRVLATRSELRVLTAYESSDPHRGLSALLGHRYPTSRT